MGRHASAHRVKHQKDIGIGNNRVRPSCGDVFADTIVGRHAFNAASVLTLNDMSKQFVSLHVIDKRAMDKIFAHVVPIHFFAE